MSSLVKIPKRNCHRKFVFEFKELYNPSIAMSLRSSTIVLRYLVNYNISGLVESGQSHTYLNIYQQDILA